MGFLLRFYSTNSNEALDYYYAAPVILACLTFLPFGRAI